MRDGVPRHVGTGKGTRGTLAIKLPSARSPESKLSSFQAQGQTLEEGMCPWEACGQTCPQSGWSSRFVHSDSSEATQLQEVCSGVKTEA